MMRRSYTSFGLALPFFIGAFPPHAQAQTNIGISADRSFNRSATGQAVNETPSNSPGVLIQLRHIRSRFVGFEANYGFNRADQLYKAPSFCSICIPIPVTANVHEVTGDWIFSLHAANLKPFVLVGAGGLFYRPLSSTENGSPAPTQTFTTAAYVYGAGIDWSILAKLGLRLEYRGIFHNAPDLTLIYGAPTAGKGNGTVLTHTAEPAVGVFYHF